MRYRLKTKNLKLKTKERGIASLGAMLLLGSVIVEVGLIGVLLVTLLTSTNFGSRLSAEAFIAAQAGIQEGILVVLRDKDGPYTLTPPNTGNAGVTVTICQNLVNVTSPGACNTGAPAAGRYEIHSVGNALGRQRWLVAVLEVDQGTGLVKIQSIQEKTR